MASTTKTFTAQPDIRGATVALIAQQKLGLTTLDTRNSDGLDFSSQAVWSLKAGLEAAYDAAAAINGPALDERERATMLAALRYYQRHGHPRGSRNHLSEDDIATDGGTLERMTVEEIDGLCTKLNG